MTLFTGLRVIDCGSYIAAPASTTIMADFGADVIKIEPPGAGDPYRSLPKLPGNPVSEHNFAWLHDSRSKRSIAIDLGTADGQAVLHRLAAEADVFVTNYPQRVRVKLGIDYNTLTALNDRLVYGSFTGYGEQGDEADKPGFDVTAYWARSGMMDQTRSSADAEPARAVVGFGDHPSAMTMYAAIISALYQRERTGKGSLVSSSLLANGLWANSYLATAALCGAQVVPRPPREQAFNALSAHYQCRDGSWLLLSILNEDRHWPVLARCIGRADLLTYPRFATKADRLRHARDLIAILDQVFSSRDRADWVEVLKANGIVFDIVARPADLPNDEQIRVNGIAVAFPERPELSAVDSPFTIHGVRKIPPKLPPSIGGQTDDVLGEAGYGEAEIEKLRASGTVA